MPVNGLLGRAVGAPAPKQEERTAGAKQTEGEGEGEEASTCTVCTRGSHAPSSPLSGFDPKDIVFVLLLVCTGLLLLTVKILFEVRASLDLVLHLQWGRRARIVYDDDRGR